MKVWIDQELCTGDGLCEEICPSAFVLASDGLSYVLESGAVLDSPGGEVQKATVPADEEDSVREAVEECPGECIFISD